MRKRVALLFVLTALASLGAEQRTTNFIVYAQDPQVCQQIAQWAEHYRREKAIVWVGREMPTWPQPCPLHVTVSMKPPSGATSFNFGQGRVLGMKMEIQGPLDRLIHSVLPHEITHTVFAHHFRCPVPRWADEGGSVLSEDEVERVRHDKLVRQILNQGQQIPLRKLFGLKEYPPQVHCLYAQGFSMTDFLVGRSDRKTFLAFVGHGMQTGWDTAVKAYYGHNTVEELEYAWLAHLRKAREQPGSPPANTVIAANQEQQRPGPAAAPANRTMVRLTVPPTQPLEPQPTVRGAMPAQDEVGQRFNPAAAGRPTHLPPAITAQPGARPDWHPGARPPVVQLQAPVPIGSPAPPPAPPQVQLGPPEYGPSTQIPPHVSPVGYPR